MKTSDFDYHLPPELIAQTPIEPRDRSRLMVVDRQTGAIRHTVFSQLPGLLRAGDLLVFNDSRVVPARLVGRKEGTGGKVEILLLRRGADGAWEVLLKPSRRLRPGASFRLAIEAPIAPADDNCDSHDANASNGTEVWLEGRVIGRAESGAWMVSFNGNPDLERMGRVPLPPYVKQTLDDPERYQTVYCKTKGSVAAPTAGLHFTPELLADASRSGIGLAFLTTHIGLDTFRPVAVEDPAHHPIHSEWGELTEPTAQRINQTRASGGRVAAVGTSSVRLLETAAVSGEVRPFSGWTRLFISPGHQFRAVDCLLTNFHLPRTTLLMLVTAFARRDLIMDAYEEAIRERYRFYSFGDAMLIV